MEEFSFADIWAVFKRRFKIFAAMFAIILVVGLGFAAQYSVYRSTATVEIEASEIPTNFTMPAGMSQADMMEALADLRISRLRQKVTSTGSLVEIITKFDLYAKKRENTPIAQIAEDMRKKIKLELISSMLANPASAQKATAGQLSAIAFNLSFDYANPLVAQQVTNELISRFLDEDLKQRRSQAEETTAFLDEQLKVLETAMAEQEKKISEYKQESGDTRPEALMFNQQAAAQVSMSLQNIESQIASTEGTISALRAQLSSVDPYSRAFADGQVLASPSLQLKALQTKYATLTAQYGPDHPDVVKTGRQIEALKGQAGTSVDRAELQATIDDVATRLAAAQKTYGPENPEVTSLTRQLDRLKATKAAQKSGSNDLIKQDADNPAYLSIVSQLRSAEGQRKGLAAQRESLMAQQEKYRKAVVGNPVAEQMMASLTRDYDNAQMRYRELKAKKLAADMGEQMERDRKGQKMTVINPPELPLQTKPPRILLFIGAFMAALMSGLCAVIAAHLMLPAVHGAHQMQSLTGVPPLASIPYIHTQAERFVIDRNKRYTIGAGALILMIIAAVWSFNIMPFDAIGAALTGRIGSP